MVMKKAHGDAGRKRPEIKLHGFTLMELLVTISIIGVILAITLPALLGVKRDAKTLLCSTRLSSIGRMYELYAQEHRGVFPTFDFSTDPLGVADPVQLPEWGVGGGGWLVLPISEIWFWGYHLRTYAADDPDSERFQAIENLSCPIVYDKWRADLAADEIDGAVQDPMYSPQRSYVHSTALFTAANAWSNPSQPPDVNTIHSTVRIADVAHPSVKSNLVEASAHHDPRPVKLEDSTNQRFNILAVDGHVEIRRADDSTPPVGFVGAPTGYEVPPISFNEWEAHGLRFISTRDGALGRDW